MRIYLSILVSLFFMLPFITWAQTPTDSGTVDFSQPHQFQIGGLVVTGTQYLDKDILITLSGLKIGDKITIPGTDVAKALKNLWGQGLFSNVSIYVQKVVDSSAFLEIRLSEKPRLGDVFYEGLSHSQQGDIKDKVKLDKGTVLTDNVMLNTKNTIERYYSDKGYPHAEVAVVQTPDSTMRNTNNLTITVDRGKRIKIDKITFYGNKDIKSGKLKHQMKKTNEDQWYTLFSVSKFIPKEYEADKQKVIDFYNDHGYRDASILHDSVYINNNGNYNIDIYLREGDKYYFRNITWDGNTKYTAGKLDTVFGIKKGDVYDQSLLQKRINGDPQGGDVSSLYLDDGYLFFQVEPVEVGVTHDSIDLQMQMHEGPQATIDQINITGNTKTNEHVIRRVIRTLPGSKFSRADVIRSQSELSNLGFFDPQKLGITPVPHPENGTVDIDYDVSEKPSDQLQLQAGYGGPQYGLVGTLGVTFNNFSVRNIGHHENWNPLPSGDAQKLSVQVQSNGKPSQSYTVSFTEPWLGGSRPNSLTVAYTNYNLNETAIDSAIVNSFFSSQRATVGLGRQLKWPDDYFSLITSLDYEYYALSNYSFFSTVSNGYYNNFNFHVELVRNSLNNFQFPTAGSNFDLSVEFTPPYSLFDPRDYSELTAEQKYHWVEYHKWRFTGDWYSNVFGKFVLHTQAMGGFIGYYNPALGLTPFERFDLGGDGLSGYQVGNLGVDVISLRGYDADASIIPQNAPVFDKYTAELRYPISTNPNYFIYGFLFAQGGNAFNDFRTFDPLNLKRSMGIGFRVYLPIFGLVGFNYGIGFDNPSTGNTGLGGYLSDHGRFNFVIGFEPQ
jgi:outer membrane protein insertion porin family